MNWEILKMHPRPPYMLENGVARDIDPQKDAEAIASLNKAALELAIQFKERDAALVKAIVNIDWKAAFCKAVESDSR